MTVLHIKNMVCDRCIMMVGSCLRNVGITPQRVSLGVAELESPPSEAQLAELKVRLDSLGFELIEDNRDQTVERIKNIVVQYVHYSSATQQSKKLSAILTEELGKEYSSLSKLFSGCEGHTIESYAIAQRIERVKELLENPALSLKQIAFQMGYSSTAYLSAQFKSQAGITPTAYRKMRPNRKPLDSL